MDEIPVTNSAAAEERAELVKQKEDKLKELGLDPIFNQQTPPVPKIAEITPAIIETCENLKLFAFSNPYLALAGLAANQLGINKERCMLNVCFVNIDTTNFGMKSWITAINPEIIATKAPTYDAREGCLTWPNKKISAVRYSGVTVRYQGIDGVVYEREAKDFEAQVWQHEINHLNGVAEDVRDPLAPVNAKPNDPCPCGSQKRFKRCCGR